MASPFRPTVGDIERIEETLPNETMNEYMMLVRGSNVKFKLRSWQDGMPQFAVLVRMHLPENKWKGAERMILYYYHQHYPVKLPAHPPQGYIYGEEIVEEPTESNSAK